MNALWTVLDIGLVLSTIRLASPILLAALGGMFNERAGIFNIGLEGKMLIGAFLAVAGSYWSGSWLVGVGLAVLGSTLVALIFGFWVIQLRANDIIVGLSINLLGAGVTAFLTPLLFGVQGSFDPPELVGLPTWHIPVIKDIPVLGDIVSGYSPIVYFAVVAVPVSFWFLFRTRAGVRLRAVGENSGAAKSIGVSPEKMKYLSFLFSGILCGLAGAQLSLGLVTQWLQGMSAGRGFIALVAIMLAGAHPVRIAWSSLLFGLAYALAIRIQGVGVPSQFVAMLPYVLTIAVLLLVSARSLARKRIRLRASAPSLAGAAAT